MKFCRVAGAFLCVLLTGAPMMACMLPDAQLSADEMQCCKQMAGDCQSAGMPASHSCCKTVIRPHFDLRPSASASLSAPTLLWTAVNTPLNTTHAESARHFSSLRADAHGPPGCAIDATLPLRI
jgi:hypothetical protein